MLKQTADGSEEPEQIYRSEGFPRTGYFIPACVGIGVWAAQKIWCRRRVARPRVHFWEICAFPENTCFNMYFNV